MKKTTISLQAFFAVLFAAMAAAAQEAPVQKSSPDRLDELQQRIDALSREIERIKLGAVAEPEATTSMHGFGPAASKIYGTPHRKVSVGGYGEMSYRHFSRRKQNGDEARQTNQADFVRAVLYVGYKFTDRILFNSELEFEHATTASGSTKRGEVSVEQAYLDFKLWNPMGIRAGLVLVPAGFVNEIHEPPTFHGVSRPSVETSIIPSTWRENGAGLFGEIGPVSYRSYILAGLHAVKTSDPGADGFTGSSGLRGGRTGGSNTFADDKAWSSRIDVKPFPGVLAGGSLYIGQAAQALLPSQVPVTLWDVHGSAEYRGLELRALYTEGRIGNADAVNLAQQTKTAGFSDFIGRRLFGGYVQGAFDVLSLAGSPQYLAPFFRYERYDTQAELPAGFARNNANSRVEYTAGITYKPIPQVAVKLDHQWMLNQARTGINRFNLGLGYIF
ncbi:MAG: hypothetical protein HY551_03890 [Elusimicrobia bacterium]|nr:hypothetical protein [Elusimicrobiota bacterium]